MAASFCASFLIFLFAGGYSIYSGLAFTEDAAVKGYVSVALLFNAVFYHYVAGYTEMDSKVRDALKWESRVEWLVRASNQCILLSLWFWLDHGWAPFGKALIGLYISFLVWDALTWECFPNHKLFWLDLSGTVLSGLYVMAGYVVLGQWQIDPRWERTFYTFFGTLSFMYVALPVVGMFLLKFNPFGPEYRRRPGLH